jgi:hypothetical protein
MYIVGCSSPAGVLCATGIAEVTATAAHHVIAASGTLNDMSAARAALPLLLFGDVQHGGVLSRFELRGQRLVLTAAEALYAQ